MRVLFIIYSATYTIQLGYYRLHFYNFLTFYIF
jgi:hypothetical protein